MTILDDEHSGDMTDDEFREFISEFTPIKLLTLQEAYSLWKFHTDVDGTLYAQFMRRIGMINDLLRDQGRCVICGMKHHHTRCQRLTGENIEEE